MVGRTGRATLRQQADWIKQFPEVRFRVYGHTDLVGGAELNQTLSQARAETVMKQLVEKGVPADRLTAKGYGASQPLENARTAAANAKNRRTVFAVSAATAAPAATTEGN